MQLTEAQPAVVSCCLLSQNAYERLLNKGLRRSMFTKKHRMVFDSICSYRTEHKVDEIPVLVLDVSRELQKELLSWTIDVLPSLYEHYYEALEKEYIEREKKLIFSETGSTRGECLEAALRLTALAAFGQVEEETLDSIIDETKKMLEGRRQPDYVNRFGFTSRLGILNNLGFYEAGSLVTIGGGSSHGKTTFVLNMLIDWLQRDMKVVYLSNEMTAPLLVSKLICIKEGINWSELLNSKGEILDDVAFGIVLKYLESLRSSNLKLFTRPKTIPEISLIIKAHKPDVFVLDTINALMDRIEGERTDIALGCLARSMKYLAEETNSLAIIIAQLKDIYGRPTSKDMIKESRQIRDASDYMDFVYREFEQRPHSKWEQLRNVFEVYRVKGKYTGPAECFLKFRGETGQITSFEPNQLTEVQEFFRKYRKELFREEN